MSRLFDDASSQHLEASAAVVSTTPLTLTCWFRTDDAANAQVALGVSASTGRNSHTLRVQGNVAGDPVRAVSDDGGLGTAATSTGYSTNTWHHAAGVFASATSRAAYIDGGSKGTDGSNIAPSGLNRTNVGAFYFNGSLTNFMSGRIAEAVIYSVALTDAEVAALAAGVHPLRLRPITDVAGYWPLYGVASPETDYSPNGNSLTLTNSPTQANHAPVAPFSRKFWGGIPLIETAAGGTVKNRSLLTLGVGS